VERKEVSCRFRISNQLGLYQQDLLRALLETSVLYTYEMMADDAKLDKAMSAHKSPDYYFARTCKMVPMEKDGLADRSGNISRLEGLVVSVASIIPVVPAANTMLPVIMTEERITQALGTKNLGEFGVLQQSCEFVELPKLSSVVYHLEVNLDINAG
jgi:hypothetical protein